MTKAKFIVILVVALLTLIVVLQNSQTVETRILFLTIIMPRSLLLFLTALAGFILGGLACLAVTKSGKKRNMNDRM